MINYIVLNCVEAGERLKPVYDTFIGKRWIFLKDILVLKSCRLIVNALKTYYLKGLHGRGIRR
ncbi:MAG: hypothetical protein P8185_22705 [Deltaproteobacteria bacterium]